jgi:hypothetical protein
MVAEQMRRFRRLNLPQPNRARSAYAETFGHTNWVAAIHALVAVELPKARVSADSVNAYLDFLVMIVVHFVVLVPHAFMTKKTTVL